jgi:hypothetical protein
MLEMVGESTSDRWVREELLHLLSVSGTLAGICVTVVAVMHSFKVDAFTRSVIDDLFALCALLFLVCTYFIFTALRTRRAPIASALITIVDTLFLIGLTLMTVSGFLMVYTVW